MSRGNDIGWFDIIKHVKHMTDDLVLNTDDLEESNYDNIAITAIGLKNVCILLTDFNDWNNENDEEIIMVKKKLIELYNKYTISKDKEISMDNIIEENRKRRQGEMHGNKSIVTYMA